jgi:hypothetical protein
MIPMTPPQVDDIDPILYHSVDDLPPHIQEHRRESYMRVYNAATLSLVESELPTAAVEDQARHIAGLKGIDLALAALEMIAAHDPPTARTQAEFVWAVRDALLDVWVEVEDRPQDRPQVWVEGKGLRLNVPLGIVSTPRATHHLPPALADVLDFLIKNDFLPPGAGAGYMATAQKIFRLRRIIGGDRILTIGKRGYQLVEVP